VHSCGDTIEEAKMNLKEALEGYLAVRNEEFINQKDTVIDSLTV
jgi:predicted RNase H-like HicB family nuclease